MTLLKVYFFKTVEIESVVVSAHPLNVKVVSGFGIFIVGYKHNAYSILLFEYHRYVLHGTTYKISFQ